MTLEGRTALVTGAATGIGAAIAHGLAQAGARVVAADLAFEAGTTESEGIEQVRCDVADQADVRRLVADVEARHGGVDILVNNAALAGAVEMSPFEKITPEEWTRVMTVNTLAPFLCAQAVVPGMRQRRWGRIINLTSAVVFQAVPNNLHYVSSKGAIAVMTRSLAREVGRDGITVNGIAPGLTITPGIADNPGYSKEMRERIVASRCLPREEQPDDLVGACLFLAGEGAAFLTGQIVTVDGGNAFH